MLTHWFWFILSLSTRSRCGPFQRIIYLESSNPAMLQEMDVASSNAPHMVPFETAVKTPMIQNVNAHNDTWIKLITWQPINIHKISNKLSQNLINISRVDLPEAILLSCAAGPSLRTFFTWRNSSGRSPPMMVKPNPWGLFFRVVRKIAPCSWDGSRVNPLKPASSKRREIEYVRQAI